MYIEYTTCTYTCTSIDIHSRIHEHRYTYNSHFFIFPLPQVSFFPDNNMYMNTVHSTQTICICVCVRRYM